MQQRSGLIHKRHRRGKKRRDKLRLGIRVVLSLAVLALAAALSAGVVHVVERPVPPFEVLATQPIEPPPAPPAASDVADAGSVPQR